MTFTQDNKNTSTLTQDNRGLTGVVKKPFGMLMMLLQKVSSAITQTLTQDNKTSTILAADGRAAVASISQDNKSTSGNLFSSTMFPFLMDFPLLWQGNGQVINLDARN